MICSACGKELPAGVAFCPTCGSPVVQKAFCPKCGKELAPGQGFCAACGAPTGETMGNTPNVVSTSTQLQTAPLLSLRMQLWKNLGPASLWWLLSFGSPFRWKMDFFKDRIEMKSMFVSRTFLLSDVAKIRVARNLLSRCMVLTMNDKTIYVIGRPTLFHIGAAKKAYQVIAPYIPDEKKFVVRRKDMSNYYSPKFPIYTSSDREEHLQDSYRCASRTWNRLRGLKQERKNFKHMTAKNKAGNILKTVGNALFLAASVVGYMGTALNNTDYSDY